MTCRVSAGAAAESDTAAGVFTNHRLSRGKSQNRANVFSVATLARLDSNHQSEIPAVCSLPVTIVERRH